MMLARPERRSPDRLYSMLALVVLLLPARSPIRAQSSSESISDAEILHRATREYRAGLDAREDSARAIPHFAGAATAYERLWQRGISNHFLAANRARAYLLAGELGHAIAAYREGLMVFPHDRTLRTELQYAREQVAYPVHGGLAEQCRPQERSPLLREASLATLWPWLIGLYSVACLVLARAWMKRSRDWARLGGFLLGLGILVLVATLYSEFLIREEQRVPALVIGEPGTPLFAGNGEHYPTRLDRLPAGVEARILTQRGEWIQIQLKGGMVGWIPASSALIVRNHERPRDSAHVFRGRLSYS